jgi:hypothetical protein
VSRRSASQKSLDPGTGFNDRLAGYVPLVVTKMVLDR